MYVETDPSTTTLKHGLQLFSHIIPLGLFLGKLGGKILGQFRFSFLEVEHALFIIFLILFLIFLIFRFCEKVPVLIPSKNWFLFCLCCCCLFLFCFLYLQKKKLLRFSFISFNCRFTEINKFCTEKPGYCALLSKTNKTNFPL